MASLVVRRRITTLGDEQLNEASLGDCEAKELPIWLLSMELDGVLIIELDGVASIELDGVLSIELDGVLNIELDGESFRVTILAENVEIIVDKLRRLKF
jgi:hypothetical protein